MKGSCLLRMPHTPAHGAWGLQRAQTEKLQERSLVSAHPPSHRAPCAPPGTLRSQPHLMGGKTEATQHSEGR